MKFSIRLKLFSIFSGLILFFVVMSWLMNSLFLDTYYYFNKESSLKEIYHNVNSIYAGDPDEISLELEKIEQNKNCHIIIQDRAFNTKYTTFFSRRDSKPKNANKNSHAEVASSPEYIIRAKADRILENKMFIENIKDARLNSNFIRLYSTLNNGDYIFLSTPAAAIRESAVIANKFFFFTGLVTILAGSIVVLFITRRFTKPILELSEIAQRMAVLDFSRKYLSDSGDEIGQLGDSINSLSKQLEKSIFELKEANQRLKEDIEKERKIDEMRKEFISNVSHELKTPIALIQGYAEGLKVNVNEDEENKNFYCDVITDEARNMNRLVKQLLELSQLESGEFPLDRTDIDVTSLVEQVLRRNDLIIKSKGINVTVEKDGDLTANADYYMAEQVLVNYFNNAVNHLDDRKIIRITIAKKDDKVVISLFNSGRHIPEESLEKIWTSFYKVDKARTRYYGGTGLGLSIVKAAQQQHGNSCGVRNVEGGVEFWFDLDRT